MAELKPCPFCGSYAAEWFCTPWGRYKTKYYNERIRGLNADHSVVICDKCGCRTKVYLHMKNAIKAWNRRYTPEEIDFDYGAEDE